MSAARRLVAEAMRAGVVFQFRGDRLRMVPKRGEAVPAELVERAKAIRADLISYLSNPTPVAEQPAPPWGDEDWGYAFHERSAILEFDGGYDRADAERLARIEIEAMKRRTIH